MACSLRCIGATGKTCRCSCKGANHGTREPLFQSIRSIKYKAVKQKRGAQMVLPLEEKEESKENQYGEGNPDYVRGGGPGAAR